MRPGVRFRERTVKPARSRLHRSSSWRAHNGRAEDFGFGVAVQHARRLNCSSICRASPALRPSGLVQTTCFLWRAASCTASRCTLLGRAISSRLTSARAATASRSAMASGMAQRSAKSLAFAHPRPATATTWRSALPSTLAYKRSRQSRSRAARYSPSRQSFLARRVQLRTATAPSHRRRGSPARSHNRKGRRPEIPPLWRHPPASPCAARESSSPPRPAAPDHCG